MSYIYIMEINNYQIIEGEGEFKKVWDGAPTWNKQKAFYIKKDGRLVLDSKSISESLLIVSFLYLFLGGFMLVMGFAMANASLESFLFTYGGGFVLLFSIQYYLTTTNYKRGNTHINMKLFYKTIEEAEQYINTEKNKNNNIIDGVVVKEIIVKTKKEN